MPRPLLLLGLLSACGVLPPRPLEPVPTGASEAFDEARQLDRAGRRTDAVEAAHRAAGLAPDWIAPRRFLDDVARGELRTPEVLEGYRRHLAASPEDPASLYLAGRLEGRMGDERLRTARRLGPRRAWVWHGLGWNAHLRGERKVAQRYARRALALARDPYERAYFTWARSMIELELGEEDLAARLLADRLADPNTAEGDRTWLAVALARLELQSGDPDRRRRGAHRAVHLLESAALLPSEVAPLVEGASLWGHTEPGRAALHLSLAQGDDPARRRARGRLLHLERPSALALSLLEDAGLSGDRRVLRFALGDPAGAVEAWVGELPGFVLEGGVPRDPRLRTLLQAARDLGSPGGWTAEAAGAFGDALVAAGWFDEARAFASRLPGDDLALALDLDARARAGQGVIDQLARLGRAFDRGRARQAPSVTAERAGEDGGREDVRGEPIDDLDGLLEACAALLARAATQLGGPTEEAVWADLLEPSARIDYGIAGEVLHPGPTFSELDQRLGLGEAGQAVGGLAQVLMDLGRFGLFGDGLGQALDGVLLRRVLVEERAGVHLGVPWSGTIAWCDGTDLAPRAGRGGTSIAGAALHEGYWIDLSVLRVERTRWIELLARFADDLSRPLGVEPMTVGPRERPAETGLLLGAADRLRLAIMADRGGPPSLEELCQVTAIHEEGHLCDRRRYFPVGDNWLEVVALFASAGFSPAVLAQRLEERAQLVALCAVADPRLPLVELLQAAQGGGRGDTPHAAAYERLCRQFLQELARQLREQPERFGSIDPDRFLGQQTHRLTPEQVRGVALELALRRGLVLAD